MAQPEEVAMVTELPQALVQKEPAQSLAQAASHRAVIRHPALQSAKTDLPGMDQAARDILAALIQTAQRTVDQTQGEFSH